MNIKKGNIFTLLACKCPRCGKGQIFENSVFNLKSFSNTKSNCPVCNLKYEPETGFFWGAMYWSYGLGVGIMIVASIILYYLGMSSEALTYTVPLIILILLPVLYRYSRVLMLYFIYPMAYKEKFWQGFGE